MRILAIEASARVAGAAFLENGRILAEQTVNGPLTHSETLMPMVEGVIGQAGKRPEEIELITLTNGPGSFTGLRIGAATAKGLALGLNRKILPIPTLEALAFNVGVWPGLVVPMMDARRGQVYSAVYRKGQCIRQPEAVAPEKLLAELAEQSENCLFLGDGADGYEPVCRRILGERYFLAPACHKDLRAGVLAALAELKMQQGAQPIDGSALQLDYLRKPQAEREREERLASEARHG
jgi:tRNA threonylcarbamoyladenosine biosynthesis protein TsaB